MTPKDAFIGIALTLFIIGMMFDATVTFTVYKFRGSQFMIENEACKFITEPLRAGMGFNWTFIISCFMPVFFLLTAISIQPKIRKKPLSIINEAFIFITCLLLIVGAINHISGGLSWLLW